MRVVRERVDETTAAASAHGQAQAKGPVDVILELSAAARNLLNLR